MQGQQTCMLEHKTAKPQINFSNTSFVQSKCPVTECLRSQYLLQIRHSEEEEGEEEDNRNCSSGNSEVFRWYKNKRLTTETMCGQNVEAVESMNSFEKGNHTSP